MSVTINKYRIWCNTDSKWEYVWGENAPTKCPTNTTHTIDATKTAIVDKITEHLMTIREENVITGGHYQACFHEIIVSSGVGETIYDVTFPHPVSLLAAEWTNTSAIAGDEIQFTVSPDTTIGAIASGVASGVSIIPVQQSVIDNVQIGYRCELYSASGVHQLGRITEKDSNNKTVTAEFATTQSFSTLWPTYFRMNIDMVRRSTLAGQGRVQLGDAKIGGSYIPAETTLRACYANNNGQAKTLVFALEYLY